ncbi:MAG: class I SAM-dependent methyltransferase [Paludibacter sp.]|nr:class I SAM-dependent methyltransferase [Bacteroidales bacterium]MCM1069568.1 class I SAM-dependent methyltransferase [Prevotella sp.]MCM1354214.1 class I SAM-dependent methyltransferase [Bacteroides sp.]MCM1443047.1 class I SAM-dependent methyltransferase [Muribaculum sp.]MCM1482288.1 class I SAM-dependent methyltransferase [Paludibacter sp.]
MNLRLLTYRLCSWLQHRLTAVNTLGHGIHSPYLYNMVRFVFYDDNAYYCFRTIEYERQKLLRSQEIVRVDDYGTGISGNRRVCDIAASSLKSSHEAQFLFRLVNALQPKSVLELGTSLGITSAYLAVAAGQGKLVTIEGSPALAQKAQDVFTQLHLSNIVQVTGNINDTLTETLHALGSVDFVFMDANHTQEATVRYFESLLPYCHEKTVVVIDDIHHSPDMETAWKILVDTPDVTAAFNCYSLGILFFDKQFMRKQYKMRIW